MLIQIALGNTNETWPGNQVACEPIYGGSRCNVGGWYGSYEDGSTGAYAADWLRKWGVILYGPEGLEGSYDTARCREWGAKGVNEKYQEIARKHPIKTMTRVTTANAARDAIANGYPVCICGSKGRTMQRRKNGFCPVEGTWYHCYGADTPIFADRVINIQDVKEGDLVYGHDGNKHKVLKTFKHKHKGKMVKIRAVGVPGIECTPEHPFLVLKQSYKESTKSVYKNIKSVESTWESSTPEWVKAEDLKIGDCLLSPKINRKKSMLPEWQEASKNVINHPNSLYEDNDIAWLFGLYIADGNAVDGHKVCITLNVTEKDTLNRTIKAFDKLGLKSYISNKETYTKIYAYSSVLANSFREWFGYNSHEKKIPEFLFHGNWNYESIIEGIFAGDGAIAKNNESNKVITTTSKELAYQLWQMLLTVGFNPKINEVNKKGKGVYPNARKQYYVSWNEEAIKPKTGFKEDYYVTPITELSTRDNYEDYVYNFEVEEVNSYIAAGVATHNCQALVGVCVVEDGTPAFVYCNSWGDYLGKINSEVKLQSGKTVVLPDGCYLSEYSSVESDLKQGDSFAYSNFQGFPAQNLSWLI